jgi:hypothetical protein
MEISALFASLWDRTCRAPWITMGVAATVFGILLFGIGGNAPGGCAPPLAQGGQIVTISPDSSTIELDLAPAGPLRSFDSSNLGSALAGLGSDNSICFSASGDPQKTQQLDAISAAQSTVGWLRAVGTLLLAFAAVWWVMLAITNGHPWGFALGLDGRLSNSQTQIYLWFLVLTTVYLSELALRLLYANVLGGITVSPNLTRLAGISALSFGTARLNTMVKTGGAAPALLSGKKSSAIGHPPGRDLLRHLCTNDDGLADLADTQMIVLTAIAAMVYVGVSAAFLANVSLSGRIALPPVDDTLLSGTAISQGAYLFKKLGSRPGN